MRTVPGFEVLMHTLFCYTYTDSSFVIKGGIGFLCNAILCAYYAV